VIVPPLPATLAPPPPFPLVIAQSLETEFVAPGVRRGIYRMQTSVGPLVVTVVAVDPHEPSVRLSTVLANDRLVSSGETVSSMARRTDAVAGINADYFDIGQTNQPLNVVVRDGALLRTPSKRVALDVGADKTIRFEPFSFNGTVTYGATAIPLTGVNEWPPNGGASLLTPAFGPFESDATVAVAELAPLDAARASGQIAGAYRVVSVEPGGSKRAVVDATLLGFGPAARAAGPLPNAGDDLRLDIATAPPLDSLASAVGGGPLLVSGGAPADDPNAPAPEERDVRFPVAGAAILPRAELLLVAVDGRNRAYSVGVTRPEFAALFLGFGATDAMAFDSGGSATLVARVLGDAAASVLNAPSDGSERNVADGFFVYSDAPRGPAAQLIVRPRRVVELPDTPVTVARALVDAAGHAVAPMNPLAPYVLPGAAASRSVAVCAEGLCTTVDVEIVAHLTRLDIAPAERDPEPGATVVFSASGSDASGRSVSLGERVLWSSDRGRFERPGVFVVPERDARIVAEAGGARAEWLLRVGRHPEPLDLFETARSSEWHFDASPAGAPGGLAFGSGDAEMSLRYDFTGGERAAYANVHAPLPGEPQAFTVEIDGDGSGVGVRVAFVNALGERRALTLARAVTWRGRQPVTVILPPDLNPPVTLASLYVVDSLANAPARAAGSLGFRNASVTVAGTP
jgi:hypothetical protein